MSFVFKIHLPEVTLLLDITSASQNYDSCLEVSEDGSMVISKPPGTGGKVTVGTVAEQML